ncbi:complexed with Cef1 [Malassezia pachydermatis]|uniref:Cwf15 cwc15 cell cycle control protein n=1 Tax=Malassezia pachydermatis TaxID=77020 RepID=A0A0M8MID9_9BASI|nr:cwf15 cwc15 cell cycle control protein [Malassezia pachydermatis]KOS13076.1 cwf15 cwc15 cell cycle control protein [Malassezia pachydermatis]
MSSAHRPTWEPAQAKSDRSHMSMAFSKHSLPAQTKLKFRRPGDVQKRSLQELKDQLAAGEKRAYAQRHPEEEFASEEESKRQKVLASAEELDADDEDMHIPAGEAPPSRTLQEDDDDDDDSDVDSDEDDSDEEDDAEALLRELEKIKQERREEQERREQSEQAQEQLTREEEIARGNPLLNLEQALHGRTTTTSAQPARWDDDLIFRNQAAQADNGLSKRGFVNDLTRTEFHKKFMSRYIK